MLRAQSQTPDSLASSRIGPGDVAPRTRRFKVRTVNDLPYPEPCEPVIVSTKDRFQVIIRVGDRRLFGRLDPRRRRIVGDYFGLGSFTLTFQGSRLYCEVNTPDRGSSPSWIADEDDPGDGGRRDDPPVDGC